jgi:hypothetical protein
MIMPSPVNVSLDVRNFSSGGADGYTDVAASNVATYSYKYTGGTDSHGNVNVTVGRGQAAINVTVGSDSRYSITNVTFNPADTQFTWHAGGHAAVAVILDTAATVVSVKYTTIVTDGIAHCTVPCDPVIHNVPG